MHLKSNPLYNKPRAKTLSIIDNKTASVMYRWNITLSFRSADAVRMPHFMPVWSEGDIDKLQITGIMGVIRQRQLFVQVDFTLEIAGNGADIRKKLFRIYNDVNKDIYGSGVIELKINVTSDMIFFYTRHNRVQALKVLEDRYLLLKQSVDYALFTEFKLRLGEKLKEQMGIIPKSILRDYDPDAMIAVTIVFLKDHLSEN